MFKWLVYGNGELSDSLLHQNGFALKAQLLQNVLLSVQIASILKQMQHTFTGESFASRWMGISLYDISHSRQEDKHDIVGTNLLPRLLQSVSALFVQTQLTQGQAVCSQCWLMFSLLQDGEELRTAINNKLPAKIDIGPVYNVDPKHRNAYAGQF